MADRHSLRSPLINRDARVALLSARRQGARRKHVLHGPVIDEQGSRRAKSGYNPRGARVLWPVWSRCSFVTERSSFAPRSGLAKRPKAPPARLIPIYETPSTRVVASGCAQAKAHREMGYSTSFPVPVASDRRSELY